MGKIMILTLMPFIFVLILVALFDNIKSPRKRQSKEDKINSFVKELDELQELNKNI